MRWEPLHVPSNCCVATETYRSRLKRAHAVPTHYEAMATGLETSLSSLAAHCPSHESMTLVCHTGRGDVRCRQWSNSNSRLCGFTGKSSQVRVQTQLQKAEADSPTSVMQYGPSGFFQICSKSVGHC